MFRSNTKLRVDCSLHLFLARGLFACTLHATCTFAPLSTPPPVDMYVQVIMNGRSHRGQSAGFDPAPPSHHQPIIMAPWIARRPSRAPPDPWEGQQVAYVGQDPLCGSSGGCSQQRSSARSAVTSSMGIGFSASHLLGPSSHNAGRVSDDGGRGGCNRDHVGAVDVPAVGASPQGQSCRGFVQKHSAHLKV